MGYNNTTCYFSFLPVFKSQTQYMLLEKDNLGISFKHLLLMSFGFVLMFIVHRIPYIILKVSQYWHYCCNLLLIYTNSQETIIQGANASRWIEIPIVGLSSNLFLGWININNICCTFFRQEKV